eukprot:scaffold18162_cov129-Isochrysis_galbana.AAC.1
MLVAPPGGGSRSAYWNRFGSLSVSVTPPCLSASSILACTAGAVSSSTFAPLTATTIESSCTFCFAACPSGSTSAMITRELASMRFVGRSPGASPDPNTRSDSSVARAYDTACARCGGIACCTKTAARLVKSVRRKATATICIVGRPLRGNSHEEDKFRNCQGFQNSSPYSRP